LFFKMLIEITCLTARTTGPSRFCTSPGHLQGWTLQKQFLNNRLGAISEQHCALLKAPHVAMTGVMVYLPGHCNRAYECVLEQTSQTAFFW
jgi:hypothetical protein